jgi:transposase, IS6 family
MMNSDTFEGGHFPKEIILQCVRWYLGDRLSSRNLSEMMQERGVKVDNSTIWRWPQCYEGEIERRARPYLKPTNDSYRTDQTYIKVKGKWKYLYREFLEIVRAVNTILCLSWSYSYNA